MFILVLHATHKVNVIINFKDSFDYTNRKPSIQAVTKTSKSGIFEQKGPMQTALLDPYLKAIIDTILYFHPTQFSVTKKIIS